MITLSHGRFRVNLTFGFFFILAITALRDNSLGTLSLVFCIAHELGHLMMMSMLRVRVSEIKLYGAGISISSDGVSGLSSARQALIYLSGPLTNLLLALCFSGDLRALNICLAVFNLLPVYYFDGGKLIGLILPEKGKAVKAFSALSYVGLTILVIFAIALRRDSVSPSSFVTLCFIALSWFLDE